MRSVVSVLVVSLAVAAGAMASTPANAGPAVAAQAKQEGVPKDRKNNLRFCVSGPGSGAM